MKRELSGGITSRKRFAGKLDFSAKQVSTTLLLLLFGLLMPQGLKAQSVDGLTANETYDFQSYVNQGLSIEYGDDYTGFSENGPKYMKLSDGSDLNGRFATPSKNGRHWFLRNKNPYGLWGYSNLAICGMWNGDRVRITVAQGSIKFVEANSAKMNGSLVTEGQEATGTVVFAAAKDGDVIISTNGSSSNYTVITKVEFFYSGNGHSGDWKVSFNSSSINLEGGQTYSTNASVTPSWVTPTFTSSNDRVATVDENGVVTAHRIGTATITAKMDVGPEGNQYSHHSTAEMTVNVTSSEPVDPTYSYDPAIEIYDLSGQNGTTFGTSSAGFQMGDATANYLTNLNSGLSLNNRIAVTGSDWTFEGGLKNNTSSTVLNLSITNLLADDRVRITYENGNSYYGDNQLNFGSDATNGSSVLNSKAFKDITNDGELQTDEGEHQITRDEAVDKGVFYTMTEDGHLDLIVFPRVKITKIEIYSDHAAQMLDRFDASKGYTAYFSKTGQLIDKEHNLGGLEIHVGNEDNTQHAIVVSSDEGPVSFVYDQAHYKMARHATYGSFNVTSELPVTGTFYKFIAETNGKMTLRMKAHSVRYSKYDSQDATKDGGETQVSSACPYYVMVKNGDTPQQVRYQNKNNGATVTFSNIDVEAGKTYYLYGWWNGSDLSADCGVAELIDVSFMPNNMVYPLAKYVESGTTADIELARVSTTTTSSDLHIKKKSANISSCEPYVEGGVLKIRNIQFVSGQNPGGTILIKVGNPSDDAAPVFAYTIAYDANWQPTGWDDASRSKGHIWDFSTNPLKGLKWSNTSGEADPVDFGTAAGPGLLYDEMHEKLPDETTHSDWTLKYVTEKGDTKRDPMYLNKYPMEGDNADMMWDTEGLIFNTAANQSCINNEFGAVVNHSSSTDGGTTTDPDRYVGVRNGGSFTIPLLQPGDRVIIYMGSADAHTSSFNITGALDAIGQTIESTDEYRAGGSLWSDMGGKCQYRGAYQFISTGGDMTFTLTKGELVKLYSIQIYRGAKSGSTDCSKTNWNTTYNGVEYIPAYQVNNDWRSVTPAACYVQIHYRGKGERLRTPTVVYKSGNINTDAGHLFYAEIGEDNAPFIFFKSEKEQYGMFRMRVDDMESNGKFVADYALQNMTVGYLEKKDYPYTWDFTDLQGYANTANRIQAERTKISKYGSEEVITGVSPKTKDGSNYIEFMNNSTGEGVKTVEQWKYYEAGGNIPAGYGLQVRNEPYSGGLMWDSNQLYAGNEPFGESFGLSMEAPGANEKYNGGLRITEEGLCLTGGNWKIMIPEVGTTNAVYVRATPIGVVTAVVGDEETAFTYEGTATDGTEDKIFAVKGTGADMKLSFKNLIIKKIAVSDDPKTVNKKGYASESHKRVIDHSLTSFFTGKNIKAYTAQNYNESASTISLVEVTKPMPAATADGQTVGSVLYNNDYYKDKDGNEYGQVAILDGGFHLFVPDMHDYSGNPNDIEHMKTGELENTSGNLMPSYNAGATSNATIPQKIDGSVVYVLSYQYYDHDKDGQTLNEAQEEAFYRVNSKGATIKPNSAYITFSSTSQAKVSFAFGDFIEEYGIATPIEEVVNMGTDNDNDVYYTMSGTRISRPTQSGLYIKNGKKVYVK